MTQPTRWRLQHWLLILVGMLISLPVAAMVLIGAGQMWGREFCPDDFTTREFTYNQVPWLRFTLSGIQYTDETSTLQRSLLADGWITASVGPKRWDLIEDLSNPEHSPDHDAHFLVDFLEIPSPWLKFNNEQADKAKVFWPIVAQLARDELYIYLPEIMQLGLAANANQPPEVFARQLRELAHKAYLTRAEIRLDESQLEDARADVQAAQTFGDTQKLSELLGRLETP